MNNEKCNFPGCERNVFDDRRKCICHLENKKGTDIPQFEAYFDGLLHNAVSGKGDADFKGFVFPYIKEISYSDIKNNLNFEDAIFEGDANFVGITLNKEVIGRTYFGKVRFKNVVFEGDVNFSKNIFNNEVNFDNVTFKGNVDFSGVEFNKNVIFRDTKFPIDNDRIVKFNGVVHKNIRFQNVNLKNVSLSYSDLTNIEFFDVKWRKESYLRDKVVDEDLIGKDKNITYDAVTQLYRGLRLNYEKNYRFAESGDFFAGETNIRRKNEKFGNKIMLTIYKYLGYYGENYWFPIFWTIMIILLYPIGADWIFNKDPLISYRHDSFGTIRNSTASFFQMSTYYIGERLYRRKINWNSYNWFTFYCSEKKI